MALSLTIYGGDVQLTGNPVWIKVSGGSLPSGATDYKLLLKIISEDDKLFGAPFIAAKGMDDSGEALFDISGYVDQPVQNEFEFGVSSVYVAYATLAFNIQVQCGERYLDSDGVLQENWGSTSSVFQMLKGGLSPRQIAEMESDGSSFYSTYVQGTNWLTTRPQGDYVHPTQPVKLWYMVEASKSATFYVKTVYNDGSNDEQSEALTLDVDNIYEFNCNPYYMGVDLEPSDKVASYFDVWLDFGGSTSHVRRFTLDWNYCARPVFIMVANSLGGIDDIYLSGSIVDGFTTEAVMASKSPDRGDSVFIPTLYHSSKKGQNKWTFNTGWKTLTTIQYYRDMLLARQAWYLYSNVSVSTYSVVPILIEPFDEDMLDRRDNLFSFEFNVREAHSSPFVFDNRMY